MWLWDHNSACRSHFVSAVFAKWFVSLEGLILVFLSGVLYNHIYSLFHVYSIIRTKHWSWWIHQRISWPVRLKRKANLGSNSGSKSTRACAGLRGISMVKCGNDHLSLVEFRRYCLRLRQSTICQRALLNGDITISERPMDSEHRL